MDNSLLMHFANTTLQTDTMCKTIITTYLTGIKHVKNQTTEYQLLALSTWQLAVVEYLHEPNINVQMQIMLKAVPNNISTILKINNPCVEAIIIAIRFEPYYYFTHYCKHNNADIDNAFRIMHKGDVTLSNILNQFSSIL